MKQSLKVLSWIQIVLGALAIIGVVTSSGDDNMYGLLGGGLFLATGWVALNYIKENCNKND